MADCILLVDDDRAVLDCLGYVLEQAGYTVVTAECGEGALALAQTERPDLAVLDVSLPDVHGVELCQRLHAFSDAPVIFLSARVDEAAKIRALDAGGDDYVTKPCSVGELLARVRAALRRAAASAPSPRGRLRAGEIVLDSATHEVAVRGAPVALSAREFEILRRLLAANGGVVTRQELLDALWGADFYGDPRALDVYIHHLRAKLGGEGAVWPHIHTVRGVGYRLVVCGRDAAPPAPAPPTAP